MRNQCHVDNGVFHTVCSNEDLVLNSFKKAETVDVKDCPIQNHLMLKKILLVHTPVPSLIPGCGITNIPNHYISYIRIRVIRLSM